MIEAVGSNARCGSDVLIVNELSTTSVAPAVRCALAPNAAVVHASATATATGMSHLNGKLLFLGDRGLRHYSTFKALTRFAARKTGGSGAEPSGCSQQATVRPSASGASGGSSIAHGSNAYGQRG